ncbi:DUF1702 family protein [Actinokineospora sp.]|uniref:DUF1702 family protein n=1 Tax=Actinokineospora sp. TaxID=1872133 RepID=UPI003D6BFC8C
MGTAWRALRRRILTPNASATLLDVRGFHKKSPAAQENLETVGRRFLDGYAYAAEAATTDDAVAKLEQIEPYYRGFAYEGAGMGYAVRDGLPLGGKHHLDDFLAGEGDKHVYMVYVGLGWAMCRLPKFAWRKAETLDPLLVGLVLDGYGFHQAYFKTKRYVEEQYVQKFDWLTNWGEGQANHGIDQGIGRALWFIGGSDGPLVASMIAKFPEHRRADLWAGTGLAATYAGGADEAELLAYRDLAGEYAPMLAQASSFASEARVRAGLVIPHTRVASKVFCGMSPEDAAQLTHDARRDLPADGDVPAYEVWRQRVAGRFAAMGGVSR